VLLQNPSGDSAWRRDIRRRDEGTTHARVGIPPFGTTSIMIATMESGRYVGVFCRSALALMLKRVMSAIA